MNRFFLLLMMIGHAFPGDAQINSKSTHYTFQLQELYSTHRTPFFGTAFTAGKELNSKLRLGVGAEYSFASQHPDNEFALSKLKFVPVYVDLNWLPCGDRKFKPYFHTSHGVSFNSYRRTFYEKTTNIRELGYYAYIAPGIRLNADPVHALSFELGLKGFKMSTNNLDINPHGLTGRLGYSF